MAATVTVVKQGVEGDHRYLVLDVLGDASYATGGYDITSAISAAFPLGNVFAATSQSNGTHWALLDGTNKKLLFRLQTTGAEVANAGSAATTVRVTVRGQ